MKTDSVLRINLACGRETLKGWLNVDNCTMFPDCEPDLISDIFDLSFQAESVDEIRLSHFIMYTRPEELRPLLKIWFSWLKKDGKLDIECIDIKKVCEIVATGDQFLSEPHGLINIFGTKETCTHRWGWSTDALMLELYDAGFKECFFGVGQKKPARDFRVVAIKR